MKPALYENTKVYTKKGTLSTDFHLFVKILRGILGVPAMQIGDLRCGWAAPGSVFTSFWLVAFRAKPKHASRTLRIRLVRKPLTCYRVSLCKTRRRLHSMEIIELVTHATCAYAVQRLHELKLLNSSLTRLVHPSRFSRWEEKNCARKNAF